MRATWKTAAIALTALAGALLGAPALADTTPAAPAAAATPRQDFSWVERLPHQTGQVEIAEAKARLNLGDDYYFLGPVDAKRVLTEVWRNPPDAVGDVLGMVFPKRYGPMDDGAWAAVVTFEDVGYVSDDDAGKIDPPKLLDQLRQDEAQENEQRRKEGYDTIHLAGWAEPPSYDRATHSAVWARDLEIGGSPDHTLNYGIRVLGRHGVLGLNIVAPMAELADVRKASDQVRGLAAYDTGERYADVDKGRDKMAEYGVAGLIAAGVGAAAVKKLGLLAVILAFGKKAIVLIAAAGAATAAWFRKAFGRLFSRNRPPSEGGDIVR